MAFVQLKSPKLLVVGQPGETLPSVQAEIDDLQQLGEFVDVLVGSKANRDQVLSGLQLGSLCLSMAIWGHHPTIPLNPEGGSMTPDEPIYLAALLFCGFRSVVGTLWEMGDEDGPMISREFYKHMFRKPGNKADFRDSAEALSVAVRALRKNGVPLDRWVLIVHISA